MKRESELNRQGVLKCFPKIKEKEIKKFVGIIDNYIKVNQAKEVNEEEINLIILLMVLGGLIK